MVYETFHKTERRTHTARAVDSTLHFLRRPYDFVSTVCSRTGGNMFETRLLLRRTVCLRGEAAAEMFYDKARMSRDGAMPEPVRATLTGKGGVQGLDGERHLRRKEMFVSLLTQERVEALGEKFEKMWLAQLPAWTRETQVIFYEALHPILAEAVCDWAGVPLPAEERIKRTRDLVLLPNFDRAAALGLGHFRSELYPGALAAVPKRGLLASSRMRVTAVWSHPLNRRWL